MAHLHSSIVSI